MDVDARHTVAIDRSRLTVQDYTVSKGDSIFGIAKKFDLSPESVLWANYGVLNDNPDMISLGVFSEVASIQYSGAMKTTASTHKEASLPARAAA